LGFGKTKLGLQISAMVMNMSPNQRVLFLEPDWDRINDIFLPSWEKYVPEDLYHHNVGKGRIEWWNGAYLNYRPRVISGSLSRRRGKFKGIEFTVVIDDETAEGFDYEQYTNTFARIRSDIAVDVRFYLTLSTPIVGEYSRFLKRGGNKIFKGRTRDNFYLHLIDPGYEQRQRRIMSEEQARRELDAELVALEGRLWKTAKPDVPWPEGNRNDTFTKFDPSKPWWLFCDFGSSSGAYLVVQKTEPIYRGKRQFDGPLWVAVADLCPYNDASASAAMQLIDQHFGVKAGYNKPIGVVGGNDFNKRSDVDGNTIAFFAQLIWGANVNIYPCDEDVYNKRIQHNRFLYLLCSAMGERRFTVAKDFVSLDTRSKRGLLEMFDEDHWPPQEKQRMSDYLPKNPEIKVQHIRDAVLMASAEIMSPARWQHAKDPPK